MFVVLLAELSTALPYSAGLTVVGCMHDPDIKIYTPNCKYMHVVVIYKGEPHREAHSPQERERARSLQSK